MTRSAFIVLILCLAFGGFVVPQQAQAQQPVSSTFSAMKEWGKMTNFIREELLTKQNSLVKAVNKQIASLSSAIVTAIQTLGANEAEIGAAMADNQNKATDSINQQAANTAVNTANLEFEKKVTPTINDCVQVADAAENTQSAVVKELLVEHNAKANNDLAAGKKPSNAATRNVTKDYTPSSDPGIDAGRLFAFSIGYTPAGTGGISDKPITYKDIETGKTETVKMGQYLTANSTLNTTTAAEMLLRDTTLTDPNAKVLGEGLVRSICGRYATKLNAESDSTVSGRNDVIEKQVLRGQVVDACYSILQEAIANRMPTQGEKSGLRAIEKRLASFGEKELQDNPNLPKAIAATVGTTGALSFEKALSEKASWVMSKKYLEDVRATPEQWDKIIAQRQADIFVLEVALRKTQANLLNLSAITMAPN